MGEEIEDILGVITNDKDLTTLIYLLFKSTEDIPGLLSYINSLFGNAEEISKQKDETNINNMTSNANSSFEDFLADFGVELY